MSEAHFLYRCYDADGRLLYIGCTKNVTRRMSLHRRDPRSKGSRWLRVSMARYEAEGPFIDYATARAAEALAIGDEQPLFNLQDRGIPMRMALSPVAEYLIEHGHRELAIETACTCWLEFRVAGVIDPDCAAHIAERRELTSAEIDVIFEQAHILLAATEAAA